MAKAKKILTTGFGMPFNNDLSSMTAGEKRPMLIQDVGRMDSEAPHSKHHNR